MRIALPLLLLALLFPQLSQAQDVRYVSDKSTVPLRSGPGNEFRIVHRGIPSGTKLTVAKASSDDEWSKITTVRGTSGWIRSQYLMQDRPAAQKLDAAVSRASKATERSTSLTKEVQSLKTERAKLLSQINNSGSELDSVSTELTDLKKISGKSVQLDIDNRRLVQNTETLRSEVEMLQSENQRLQDKVKSEDFLDGALAVLLGVVIALVAPRLIPKRRKNSSWA